MKEVVKETLRLAFTAHSFLEGFMKVNGWIVSICLACGIGWITFDWTLSIPIGDTGYYFQIGPIIIAAICVLAVCFAIAWNTVPQLKIVGFWTSQFSEVCLEVRNLSKTKSVELPFVVLDELKPAPINMRPINLAQAHEEIGNPRRMAIGPGQTAFFMFISVWGASDGSKSKEWRLVSEYVQPFIRIFPVDDCIATVTVGGKDIPPKTHNIKIVKDKNEIPKMTLLE